MYSIVFHLSVFIVQQYVFTLRQYRLTSTVETFQNRTARQQVTPPAALVDLVTILFVFCYDLFIILCFVWLFRMENCTFDIYIFVCIFVVADQLDVVTVDRLYNSIYIVHNRFACDNVFIFQCQLQLVMVSVYTNLSWLQIMLFLTRVFFSFFR